MAEPLASFEGFEAFEGQFRATRKKDLARQSFGASEASRIQKLAALAEPLASFEGFEGNLRRLRGLRRLKGSFGPPAPRAHSLRNSAHSLAQSPEPTV